MWRVKVYPSIMTLEKALNTISFIEFKVTFRQGLNDFVLIYLSKE